MGIAIALIIGFVMGCGCAVALLFCLRPVGRTVFNLNGMQEKARRKEEAVAAEEQPQEPDSLTFEQQMENFMAFDGTKQTGKDVTKNDS